jgi:hypothetical protein
MKPLNKRFFSQLLVLGMLALMSLPFLSGCNNRSNTHKPLSAGLVKWVGSEATAQKLLDFRLPSEPMALAFFKHNPEAYASELPIPQAFSDELALFGVALKHPNERLPHTLPWIWMPNVTADDLKEFTPLEWQSLQASATQGQKHLLELPELFKLSHPGLFSTASKTPFYSIPHLKETLVYSPKWGAFLFPSTEHATLLPYLDAILKVNQPPLLNVRAPKTSWKLAEHLLPVLQDAFVEFPHSEATAESVTCLNLSGLANGALKGHFSLKPAWVVKSTSPQRVLANGNLQESSGFLIQLPQADDPTTPPLDLNTLEYLLKGSERPVMSASPSLSYVSIQHVDRLLKKGFIERLPEDKQNQLKMLNPILSLFHLNVEKDLLGLLSKRTLLVVNEQGHRAVVLEPTPDKQKTLNALVKHLGQGGHLNEVVLKSKASSNKQVLDVLPWKDQATLLKVNDALALSPFLKPLRVYRSSQGIFLSGKEFFEHSSPQQLDASLHFDPKALQLAPWLSFKYPNLIASVAVLIPPALREKTPALARIYEQLHASGIRSFEGGVNLSNRTQYALSGQFVVTRHPKSAPKALAHFLPKEEVAFYSDSIGLWATALAKEEVLFNKMHVAKK